MTGETAHRSTAATKEVNGPGIIWHIPRPTRNEETVPEQIEQPTFTPRPVLSFVRRSGRLDARLQRAWDNYADTYLLDINAGEGSLDVRDDFTLDRDTIAVTWGNANPLIVEIGTGQGENIVAAAAAHPDVNFLALEVYDPGVAHTLLLAGKQRLGNLRIAQVNAPELLAATAPGSIAEVWTFFPDPWPKMKHHKRRIVQPQLAQSIHGALADGGAWRIATDIEDYALHVHEVMDAIATSPLVMSKSPRKSVETATGSCTVLSVSYAGKVSTNFALDSDSLMRSCGRFGPAIDGTTVPRSSSRYSEYCGST